jgi:hypothetical protein
VANQELENMEGSAPSEAEEKHTSSISIRRAGKVGAPATRDSFFPPLEKKREKRGKPLDDGDGDNVDQLAPYQRAAWEQWLENEHRGEKNDQREGR